VDVYIAEGVTPCQVNDPEMWMGDRDNTKKAKTAKALCRLCPERRECFNSTKRFELSRGEIQPVILAGFSATERRAKYGIKTQPVIEEDQTA
jgi:hypothetical protein